MHYLQETALLFVQYTPNKPHFTIIAQKTVQHSTKTAQKVVQFITYNPSQEILQPCNLVIKIKRTRRIHRILTDPPHYLVTHKRRSDPAGIQTLDLQNRNLTLYSAKLRGRDSANREQNTKLVLSVMPRCSLSCAKIVQTESRKSSSLELFAEVQPIFCKDK